MYDLNKIMIIGRLTRDPEIRTTSTGKQVVSFSVATQITKDKTEYVTCTAWEQLAKIIDDYARKGSQVYVEGSLSTSKYQGKDGGEKTRTEVLVKEFKLLGSKSESNQNNNSTQSQSSETNELPDIDIDDIATPF